MLDQLEHRRHLSASITPMGHLLRIEGTSSDDHIEFSKYKKNYAHIYVDGTLAMTVSLRHYTEVSFAGGDGNDLLVLGHVQMKLYADGGDGNDAISASSTGNLSDTLLGGSGNDYLYGGPGDDDIDGGGGDDGMFGDAGNDTIKVLSDSMGDDTVSGGTGIDTADFSNYNRGVSVLIGNRTPGVFNVDDFVFEDVERVIATSFADTVSNVGGRPVTVFLGGGNDTYTGGRASETIFGGAGVDHINTVGGDDYISTQADGQADIVDGGSGNDTGKVDSRDMLTSVELTKVVPDAVLS